MVSLFISFYFTNEFEVHGLFICYISDEMSFIWLEIYSITYWKEFKTKWKIFGNVFKPLTTWKIFSFAYLTSERNAYYASMLFYLDCLNHKLYSENMSVLKWFRICQAIFRAKLTFCVNWAILKCWTNTNVCMDKMILVYDLQNPICEPFFSFEVMTMAIIGMLSLLQL